MSTRAPRRKRRVSLEPSDLNAERETLMRRLEQEQRTTKQTEARYRMLEQELNDLASLYVASFQLSNTLSVRRVLRHISELLEQLVGAQSFAIYVLSPDGKQAWPVSTRGNVPDAERTLPSSDARFGEACLSGTPEIRDLQRATPGEPIAVLPLNFDGEVVGVITIHELLGHKGSWALVDHELFKLVCAHGAVALIAANLYHAEAGPRAALRDLREKMAASLQQANEPDSVAPHASDKEGVGP
ncbi:MAG TPA: GAF domain-containing protein [Polyangiales bacterium]|jgi:GAF domain-containing protein|nr:GAF domain-containing protein [Polyangiales bacterium]